MSTQTNTGTVSRSDRDFHHLGQPGRMRWYARVIAEGVVRPSMPVRIL